MSVTDAGWMELFLASRNVLMLRTNKADPCPYDITLPVGLFS